MNKISGLEDRVLGPFEKINLYFPFIFIFLSLGFLFIGHQETPREAWAWKVVAAYFFFNATHVGLTFVILGLLPEARRLVLRSWLEKKNIIFLSVFVFIYLFSASLLKKYIVFSSTALVLIFFVPLLLLYRHAMMQNFGVLMLYNKNCSNSQLAPTPYQLNTERILFRSMSVLFVLYQLDKIIYKDNLLLNKNIWLSIIVLASLITIFFVYKISFLRSKKVYILRLLLYPLSMVSLIADSGIKAIHGVEYTLLTVHMINNSTYKSKRKLYFYCGAFILLLTIITSIFVEKLQITDVFNPLLFKASDDFKKLMLTCLFTIEYFHYYLDSLMFKFSSSLVREEIYPLLRGPAQIVQNN